MSVIERLEKKDGVIKIPRAIQTKIIEYSPVSNDAVYKIKDPLYVYQLLIKYKDSFKDDEIVKATLDVIDYYISIRFKEEIAEKTDKNWTSIDKAVEKFYEFFPCFFRA